MMLSTISYWITVYMGVLLITAVDSQELRKYCQFDDVNITCKSTETLLMQSADLGRMALSKCIDRDYGYMGCSVSVLSSLDKRCSGGRSCYFEVAKLREEVQPCPKDLALELEAGYKCEKVLNEQGYDCRRKGSIKTKDTTGYISSVYSLHKSGGSSACPIEISAQRGQRINLSLLSFGLHKSVYTSRCAYYAVIKDGKEEHNISMCKDGRQAHLFVSKTERVSVYIKNVGYKTTDRHLIYYEFDGCPNIPEPPNAVVERKGTQAVVSCKHSRDVWYLTCAGTQWKGTYSNCSESLPYQKDGKEPTDQDYPFGLAIAITIGVLLGVSVGTAMLITVFMLRKRKRHQTKEELKQVNLMEQDPRTDNEENYSRRPCIVHDYRSSGVGYMGGCTKSCCGRGQQCGDYTQMLELSCTKPCSASDIYADRRACAKHVNFSDTPSLPRSVVNSNTNTPGSFQTFKPNIDTSDYGASPGRHKVGTVGLNLNVSVPSLPPPIETDDSANDQQPDVVQTNNNNNDIPGLPHSLPNQVQLLTNNDSQVFRILDTKSDYGFRH